MKEQRIQYSQHLFALIFLILLWLPCYRMDFPNIAHLLSVPGMNKQLFKSLAPRVTARSETFRILSEGTIRSSGVRQRMEVVVKLTSSSLETLSYREDL